MSFRSNVNMTNSYLKEKKATAYIFLLFMVWPFAALIVAIKNYSCRYYRFIIVIFGFFYGYTFIPIPNSDVTRHVDKFVEAGRETFWNNAENLITIYSIGTGKKDIYLDFMIFFSSFFTTNEKVFLGLIGLVYFLVFTALINRIIELAPGYKGKFFQVFLLGCVFIYTLSAGVNGIRFPLAFLIFSYGSLSYLVTNKSSYVLLASISVLVHVAILYSFAFLLGYYLIRPLRNHLVLISLLAFLGFVNVFISDTLANNISFMGPLFETKYNAYTQSEFIDTRTNLYTNWNWYLQIKHLGNYYFPIFIIPIVYIYRKKLVIDKMGSRLLGFSMLLLLAGLITGGILDTTTNRYIIFARLFSLILLFYLGSRNINSFLIRALSFVFMFILVINILVIFRSDLYTVSPALLIGNPLIAIFVEFDQSVQNLLLK